MEDRIEIYFDGDERWYVGTVKLISRFRGFQVAYDPIPGEDDRIEYVNLDDKAWRMAVAQANKPTAPRSANPKSKATAVVLATSTGRARSAELPPPPLLLHAPTTNLLEALDGYEEKLSHVYDLEQLTALRLRLQKVEAAVSRRTDQLCPVANAASLDTPD